MELIISRLNSIVSRNLNKNFNITDDEFILDVVSKNKFSDNDVYYTIINGYLGLIKYFYHRDLKINKIGKIFINRAAGNNHIRMTKYLENKGLKVNQDGINLVVRNGHLEMVKHLYDKGLKVDQDGIMWAIVNGNLEMIKYLYDKG